MKSIYERLAEIHGCAAEDVEAEIAAAIQRGRNSADPAVQRIWSQMPRPGENPSTEEVLSYCVAEALRRTSAK